MLNDELLVEKLDKLDDRLNSVDKTLVAQHVSLNEHIRRTALLEEQAELLRQELKPVQQHVHLMNMLAKIGVALTGVFATLYKLLG
jgi:hypothetical protein